MRSVQRMALDAFQGCDGGMRGLLQKEARVAPEASDSEGKVKDHSEKRVHLSTPRKVQVTNGRVTKEPTQRPAG
jgi:hypothetical protein